ncbi:Cof-type HAD-IIB family hydrolase [Mesoplasma photuris]|uniref:Cof-type HAD-IIB family hydrolase n=1 Tax=Mesoplasma photuris TaxID=217731 RepID=UPI0004E17C79|nr:Cof-type HAD-IIB family hydrolase [Mesoplasma photuris]
MNKDIKLLVLDMDGTSYYKMGTVVEANVEPLKELIKQGTQVAFVTGRPVLSKMNQIEENGLLGENSFMGAFNGSCIYDLKNKKILSEAPIDNVLARKIFELANQEKYANIIIWGYSTDMNRSVLNVVSDNKKIYHGETNFFDGEMINYNDVKDTFKDDFYKFLAFNANPEFMKELKDLGLEVATNNGEILEINKKDVNKKFAIKWFEEKLKITKDNIMSVGDGMNDFSMIEYTGVGVALKNSVDPIKEIADLYIDINSDDGAIKYLVENYLLKK